MTAALFLAPDAERCLGERCSSRIGTNGARRINRKRPHYDAGTPAADPPLQLLILWGEPSLPSTVPFSSATEDPPGGGVGSDHTDIRARR